jgi:argininosuccinate lyase
MNIEAVLTKQIGAAGAKLHTARSRNDQVALNLRLYVKAEIAEIGARLRSLQTVLLNLAEQHIDVVMPVIRTCSAPSQFSWRIICWRK